MIFVIVSHDNIPKNKEESKKKNIKSIWNRTKLFEQMTKRPDKQFTEEIPNVCN
jgi:hypothetical protein